MAASPTQLPTLDEAYGSHTLHGRYKHSAKINGKVSLWRGDITTLAVDGIQNAANPGLVAGGSGINAAIHAAAGPRLAEACAKVGGCHPGDTKITKGYNLPSKCILHAAGPVYTASNAALAEEQLMCCYISTLRLAAELSVLSPLEFMVIP